MSISIQHHSREKKEFENLAGISLFIKFDIIRQKSMIFFVIILNLKRK